MFTVHRMLCIALLKFFCLKFFSLSYRQSVHVEHFAGKLSDLARDMISATLPRPYICSTFYVCLSTALKAVVSVLLNISTDHVPVNMLHYFTAEKKFRSILKILLKERPLTLCDRLGKFPLSGELFRAVSSNKFKLSHVLRPSFLRLCKFSF